MELQGELIDIKYKNELNSYCVGVLKLEQNSKEKYNSEADGQNVQTNLQTL